MSLRAGRAVPPVVGGEAALVIGNGFLDGQGGAQELGPSTGPLHQGESRELRLVVPSEEAVRALGRKVDPAQGPGLQEPQLRKG